MRSNWLVVTTEDNFQTTLEVGLIGVSDKRRHAMGRLKKGDRLLFYLSRKSLVVGTCRARLSQFVATGRVIGNPFQSNKKIWNAQGRERYPYRVAVSIKPASRRVRVPQIVHKLSFLKNNEHWGGFLATLRPIPDKDYDRIEKLLGRKTARS